MLTTLEQTAEQLLIAKIGANEAFTVRDITRATRSQTDFANDPSQEVRHEEVRQIVRRIMDTSYGKDYTTSVARFPGHVGPQPIVYHPVGADLSAYGYDSAPGGAPQLPKCQISVPSTLGQQKLASLSISIKSGSGSAPAQNPASSNVITVRKLTRRGQVSIPRPAVRLLGLGYMSKVFTVSDPEGMIVYPDGKSVSEDTVSKHHVQYDGAIRIGSRFLLKAGVNADKCTISWKNGGILLAANND